MERLSFASTAACYNATEAAIHMARYQLAVPYCEGARVLDVACGEGYGTHVLQRFGASSVEGIDNSPAAIEMARSLFSKPGIRFQLHDAMRVDELFSAQAFDLVVSLETIEHLRNPKRFLRAIRKIAKDDAVIIISCPNDNWYYRTDNQSNPYHVAKYSFESFRELTTQIFGDAAIWGYGAPVTGFANIADDLTAGKDPLASQVAMLDFRRQASAIALPPRNGAQVGPRNCSYFVGVWGGKNARLYTSAIVPLSMDEYSSFGRRDVAGACASKIDVLEQEKLAALADKQQLADQLARVAAEGEEAKALNARLLERAVEERERYRIQTVALGREVEITTGRLRELGELLAERQAALDRRRQELVECVSQSEDAKVRAEQAAAEAERGREQALALAKERDEALLRAETARNDVERYRVQALALGKELEIVRAQMKSLAKELEMVSSKRQPALARQVTKPFSRTAVMRRRLVIVARRVRPHLPPVLLGFAQRVARALGL
jgi:SAM-dependent methyltransferase